MFIKEMINNTEFSFNPHFRIYEYVPPETESDEEGECILKYDSFMSMDYPEYLDYKDISAVNQANDGAVEIEYMEVIEYI